MSEQPLGAGARIAAARQQRGLALDTLATQLKVSVARLEALEREQWEQLPDATHARALATSVCRALGLDAAPVLAAMPRGAGAALERVSQGLNEPVRSSQGLALPRWALPALLLALLAGAALWLVPRKFDWASLPGLASSEPVTPAAGAQARPLPVSEPAPVVALQAASQPASVQAPVAIASEPPLPSGTALLELRAVQGASWVSVSDAQGVTLAAQLLNPGESLNLSPSAALPLRLVLGNAPALELRWRGQLQALDGYEQRRVAKLELK